MKKLLPVSARRVLKLLNGFGFRIIRQSGSHIHLIGRDNRTFVTVPNHPEISKKTLNYIIKQSSIDRDVFLKLL